MFTCGIVRHLPASAALQSRIAFSEAEVANITLMAARCIVQCHARVVVHRNICPQV